MKLYSFISVHIKKTVEKIEVWFFLTIDVFLTNELIFSQRSSLAIVPFTILVHTLLLLRLVSLLTHIKYYCFYNKSNILSLFYKLEKGVLVFYLF